MRRCVGVGVMCGKMLLREMSKLRRFFVCAVAVAYRRRPLMEFGVCGFDLNAVQTEASQ